MSQSLVSKHLRVLRQAGVVKSEVAGKRRIYRLTDRPLPDVLAWVTPYIEGWSASFVRLAEALDEENNDDGQPAGTPDDAIAEQVDAGRATPVPVRPAEAVGDACRGRPGVPDAACPLTTARTTSSATGRRAMACECQQLQDHVHARSSPERS